MALSGDSTYGGATNVNAGVLQVDGSIVSGNVIVAGGATLAGGGSVGPANGGTVTVEDGGTLSPGTSPGQLSVISDTLTLDPDSIFLVEINGPTAGTGHDQLIFGGDASLAIGGSLLTVDGAANGSLVGSDFIIVDVQRSPTITGLFRDPLSGNLLNQGDTFSSFAPNTYQLDWTINYAAGTGNDISLTLSAIIPEPTTLLIWSLLAGLGIGAGWRRRKR